MLLYGGVLSLSYGGMVCKHRKLLQRVKLVEGISSLVLKGQFASWKQCGDGVNQGMIDWAGIHSVALS